MSGLNCERVLSVHHWTETLFSFRTTRERSFRFTSGQFTMIGLECDGRPLLRAYSMASANCERELEFFSIKVPDGPLTSLIFTYARAIRFLRILAGVNDDRRPFATALGEVFPRATHRTALGIQRQSDRDERYPICMRYQ
jgi:NAD(P)H-flavin reductase